MQTSFPAVRLQDPQLAQSERSLRKCVHCGFCLSTCPTYELLGDEADSPRGRIGLMQAMLEHGGAPAVDAVTHIDRCLGCLSCKTTCPSGVDYGALLDHAREHIEQHHKRPWRERIVRSGLLLVLTRRWLVRLAVAAGRLAKSCAPVLPAAARRMVAMVPPPVRADGAETRASALSASLRGRVILFEGCVQPVLRPQINAASRRLLMRAGFEVVTVRGEGCCAALPAHMGKKDRAKALARDNIRAWEKAAANGPVDAIIVTASGCAPTIAGYHDLLQAEPEWAARAEAMAALATELSPFLSRVGIAMPEQARTLPGVAYQAACSMQHALGIRRDPGQLLEQAGFTVHPVAEQHLCCGSAGTYSILQPEISGRLRDRKLGHLACSGGDIVASGNIGCITHLSGGGMPVVHYAELLDWATGGPCPAKLQGTQWA